MVDVDPRRFTFLDINPGYPGAGRTRNCVNCAIALDRTLAGKPNVAEPSNHGFTLSEIETETGGRLVKTDPPSLETDLAMAGNGARGIVAARHVGTGHPHAFNAVNVEGAIKFIDAQNGQVYDHPYDLFYDWYFMRTDNL